MKQPFTPHRRALAALVPTLALLAVPAVAQDVPATPAPQQVAPPPVVPTTPVQPAPAQSAPVQTVQAAPVEPPPPPDAAPARATPRAVRAPAQTRTVTQRSTTTHTTTAPAAAAPVVTPAPAPAPVAATPANAPATTPAPVEQTSSTTTETNAAPAAASTGFNWASPWLALLGVGIIALVGFIFAARRRRADVYDTYDEPVAYEEPVVAPAPIVPEPVAAAAPIARPDVQFLRREAPRATEAPAIAPVVAEEQLAAPVIGTGELVEPSDSDVEALTAVNPPVSDRPWLEMAMRPVRAGTNVDEALVEIELTVGNAGSVAADDVRISTFMFAGAPAEDEMERLLLERDGDVPAVSIKPGEGTMLEATLALPRAELSGAVSPVIVADARYPLPGGGEGRTAASFRISVSDDGETMTPIPIGRPHMFDEVSAELYGVPEHA